MSGVEVVALDVVGSTQDEARVRLEDAAPGTLVAVRARSQRAGRGREGRSWQDPPGSAVLLSIGARGPIDAAVLDQLPRDIGSIVVECVGGGVRWREPNDVVAAGDGAKVGGVLVDARTVGASVDVVVVGIGLNATGPAFTTADGRASTSIAACTDAIVDEAALVDRLVAAVGARLSARR